MTTPSLFHRPWRGLRTASRILLVGPEPRDTLWCRLLPLVSPLWRRLLTVAGAGLLLLIAIADWVHLAETTAAHPILRTLLTASHTVPLALAVRWPLRAWRISALATSATVLVAPVEGGAAGWPWPSVVGVLHLLVLAQVASTAPHGVAALAALVAGVGLVALGTDPVHITGTLGLIALVTVLGMAVAAWHTTSRRLAEQRRTITEERAGRAVLEERTRLARELHDVVAHHLSLIAVRAETAPYRNTGLDGAAADELAGVATAARAALVEMRRLLGVLRSERVVADLTPQPQLADLSDLVATARRAGVSVHLADHSELSQVPSAIGLTAYRIVQEALTNASKHAAGTPVEIELQRSPSALRIRVRNAAPPGDPPIQGSCVARHGLTGMQERVEMLAGTLTAGPTSDGGFIIEATLPCDTLDIPLMEPP